MYHTNFVWLDNIILFPLLVLFLKKLLDGGNLIPYTIVLTYSLSLSFYISFMEILFIIFFSFLYIHYFIEKTKKKNVVLNLSIGTMFALLISAVFYIPIIYELITSSGRLTISFSHDLFGDVINKFSTILIYSFPIVNLISYFKCSNDKKRNKFYGWLLFFTMVGIILEPINLMWHTGSYLRFPFRYGFISIFVIYLVALEHLQHNKKTDLNRVEIKKICLMIFLIGIIILCGFIYFPLINHNNPALGLQNNIQWYSHITIFLGSYIYFFLIEKIKNSKSKES